MSNPYDAFDKPAAATPNPYDQFDPKSEGAPSDAPWDWGHSTALLGRSLVRGAMALPLLAADAGVGARNMMGGNYELPSDVWERGMNEAGVPQATSTGEKAADIVGNMLGGAAVPGAVSPATTAPANFVSPAVAKAQQLVSMLKAAQEAGFKVPPSTTNPTLLNRILETIAGKENVQNWARSANDAARTRVGSQTLGLNPDAPLTEGAVSAVKSDAGNAYEAARSVPVFQNDNQYMNDLVEVLKANQGANTHYPGAVSPDVEKIVDTYFTPTSSGDSAVSAIKLLKSKADDAYRTGASELGRVYTGVRKAIEGQLDRVAPPGIVDALKSSRQMYAKASTVGEAMGPSGTVLGPKLAQAWNRDEPLTGPLNTAAEFAAQYPKANLSADASGSPVSHLGGTLSFLGPAGAVLMHEGVSPEAIAKAALVGGVLPGARIGARSYLLSDMGQRGAIPSLAAPGPTVSAGRQASAKALAAALARDKHTDLPLELQPAY